MKRPTHPVHWPSQDKVKFAVRARSDNDRLHAFRRIGVSYIYLLLLKNIGRCPTEGSQGASVQARSGDGVTQGAHQLIWELTVDRANIHELGGLNDRQKAAAIYCASQVSVIAAVYNKADNYIEKTARPKFLKLAQDVVLGNLQDRAEIWRDLIVLFADACSEGLTWADSCIENGLKVDENEVIKNILVQHRVDVLSLLSRADRVAHRDVDFWLDKIVRGAFRFE